MKLNPKDFNTYQSDGVIRVNNVFSKSEIINLKKKLIYTSKKKQKLSKEKKLIILKKR